jgi:hypothetical protein
MSDHYDRYVVFSSTIESCGHKPIAEECGVQLALGKISLDVVIL